MTERQKITVTEVKEIQSGERKPPATGKWEKLSFKAKQDNQEHWYQCFRNTLFPSIKVETVIDCEVEIKETEHGTERTVTQIYIDGQPVGGQKQKWGKSPEMVMAELDSKARNTSLMCACELAKVDKIGVAEILKKSQDFYNWLKGVKEETKEAPKVEKTKPEPPVKEIEKPKDKKVLKSSDVTNLQEFLAWVSSHGKNYGPTWVCREMNVHSMADITDIPNAVATIKELTGWE